jgi:hypothetical protein
MLKDKINDAIEQAIDELVQLQKKETTSLEDVVCQLETLATKFRSMADE